MEENNNSTAELIKLEKEKRRTERAKQGTRKTVIKTICTISVLIVSLATIICVFSFIFPENMQKVVDIIKSLYDIKI